MKNRTVKILCIALAVALVLGLAVFVFKKNNTSSDRVEEVPYDSAAELEPEPPPLNPGGEPEDWYEEDDMDYIPDEDFLPMEFVVDWSEEMMSIRTAIMDKLGTDYWPQIPMPAEYIEAVFGVSSDLYEDYMGEMPMMSVRVDTLLIIKAKAGQAAAIEKSLQKYREDLVRDSMEYPLHMAKIQASRVKSIGDYVCFVLMGGDVMEYEEKGDEAVIAHCQEQNDLVLKVISENIRK